MSPLAESTVIEHLQFVSDDEGYVTVGKTFLEHQQAAYTTIAILKGMDTLKANMEVKDVCKGPLTQSVLGRAKRLLRRRAIFREQSFHLAMYFLRWTCVLPSNFARQAFVVAYDKPILSAVAGA